MDRHSRRNVGKCGPRSARPTEGDIHRTIGIVGEGYRRALCLRRVGTEQSQNCDNNDDSKGCERSADRGSHEMPPFFDMICAAIVVEIG